jgi:hypothetical protein
MDFFTVPTITFGVLYCFFVIGHDRRKILRFNVTRSPSAPWIVQQMREAWPYTPAHRFLLFDHDAKFGNDVMSTVTDWGIRPVRTAFRSPLWCAKSRQAFKMPISAQKAKHSLLLNA